MNVQEKEELPIFRIKQKEEDYVWIPFPKKPWDPYQKALHKEVQECCAARANIYLPTEDEDNA